MTYSVRKSETILFGIKAAMTICIWMGMLSAIQAVRANASIATSLIPIGIYVVFIVLFLWFNKMVLVAHMKGSGICVSESQFPEIYAIYTEMARNLGLKKIPPLFILQNGGMLNAFAVRFSCKNYIAIYSDIISVYKTDMEAVKFVLGHELGHVKRGHNQKRFWTALSSIIPFLTPAYSRACEYTCDNIGAALTSTDNSRLHGLLLLAGGKDIYKEIHIENYLKTADSNRSSVVKFVNLFLSHPYLPMRIKNVKGLTSGTPSNRKDPFMVV